MSYSTEKITKNRKVFSMIHTTIESIPVKNNQRGIDALEVSAYYSLGGMSMWSYRHESRGYYISVTPVRYIARGNYKVTESHPTDGIKKCIIECSRQSAKREQAVLNTKRSEYQDLIDYVLNKTQIELTEASERNT